MGPLGDRDAGGMTWPGAILSGLIIALVAGTLLWLVLDSVSRGLAP